jgi:hypothetical protein
MAGMQTGILRSINAKDNDRLNILTFPTHESYQTNLDRTGHNFFLLHKDSTPNINKDWNNQYRPLPDNTTYIKLRNGRFPSDISFDLIISQTKMAQLEMSWHLQQFLQIPIIHLEHVLPTNDIKPEFMPMLINAGGDFNVYISEYNCREWHRKPDNKNVFVIEHGMDTDFFDGYVGGSGKILTVVNQYLARGQICGFDLYKQVTHGLPVMPVGDTPGFSKPAPNINALRNAYRSCGVFLNTSIVSPVPMSLMEAMSVGCPVVTTNNCMIPEIVQNGVNGFASNDPVEIRKALEWCLNNPSEAKKIGENGRKTIQDKFSLKQFVDKWNQLFRLARGTLCKKMYGLC